MMSSQHHFVTAGNKSSIAGGSCIECLPSYRATRCLEWQPERTLAAHILEPEAISVNLASASRCGYLCIIQTFLGRHSTCCNCSRRRILESLYSSGLIHNISRITGSDSFVHRIETLAC